MVNGKKVCIKNQTQNQKQREKRIFMPLLQIFDDKMTIARTYNVL